MDDRALKCEHPSNDTMVECTSRNCHVEATVLPQLSLTLNADDDGGLSRGAGGICMSDRIELGKNLLEGKWLRPNRTNFDIVLKTEYHTPFLQPTIFHKASIAST